MAQEEAEPRWDVWSTFLFGPFLGRLQQGRRFEMDLLDV